MMTTILVSALLTAGPPNSPATSGTPQVPSGPPWKVIFVPDGDSVVLLADGRTIRVWLLGVLPPTDDYREGSRGPRAEFLRGLVMDQAVQIQGDPGSGPRVDEEGHEQAHLYRVSDGLWVNREMIRQGYGRAATAYRFEAQDDFRTEEAGAREGQRGLWAADASLLSEEYNDQLRRMALELRRKALARYWPHYKAWVEAAWAREMREKCPKCAEGYWQAKAWADDAAWAEAESAIEKEGYRQALAIAYFVERAEAARMRKISRFCRECASVREIERARSKREAEHKREKREHDSPGYSGK